jgi:hypothetical protein
MDSKLCSWLRIVRAEVPSHAPPSGGTCCGNPAPNQIEPQRAAQVIGPAIQPGIAFGGYECFLLRRLQFQGTTGPIEKAVPE